MAPPRPLIGPPPSRGPSRPPPLSLPLPPVAKRPPRPPIGSLRPATLRALPLAALRSPPLPTPRVATATLPQRRPLIGRERGGGRGLLSRRGYIRRRRPRGAQSGGGDGRGEVRAAPRAGGGWAGPGSANGKRERGPPPRAQPMGAWGEGFLRPTHGGGGVPRTRSYEACAEAAAWVRARLKAPPPVVGLVCGSGLGGLARELQQTQSFDYGDIPHFPRSTVQGHAGRLLVGTLGGCPCAVLQGRFHLYEGYSPAQVALPVRTLALLGAHTVVLTNAAGSLRAGLEPGQLLVIRDHIDLPGLAGRSPLAGKNDPRFGPRFPVMAGAYDAALRRLALALAPAPLRARSGVYCGVGGPSYETPAECALLRRLGGDAVGMSTVAEAAAARHCGLRVLGLSLITNAAPGGDEDEDTDEHAKDTDEHAKDMEEHAKDTEEHAKDTAHEEVLEAAQAGARLLAELLLALAPRLQHA
ncbi:uncharacterized protein ACIB01_019570 [Guaruba guarouba]